MLFLKCEILDFSHSEMLIFYLSSDGEDLSPFSSGTDETGVMLFRQEQDVPELHLGDLLLVVQVQRQPLDQS